jgi:DNA invertase Pin-like site-specific DNA recombinase
MKRLSKKVIIVARKSRPGQRSEEWQLDGMQKYCERENLEITETIELSESAWKSKRKGFEILIDKIAKYHNEFKEPIGLCFWECDRYTRRGLSTVMVKLEEMRLSGKIERIYAKDDRTINKFSSSGDIMQEQMLIVLAEEESTRKSQKIKQRWLYEMERGQYKGYVPTGYKNDSATKKIIIDCVRAPLIKEAFEFYATGEYSILELTMIMRGKGLTIKPKKGKEKLLTKSDLLCILHNQFYAGRCHWKNPNTDEIEYFYASNYEPIISDKLFQKVQNELNRKSIKFSTRHSVSKFFKFRGLMFCGFCGSMMTPNERKYEKKNKTKYEKIYYRCTFSKKAVDPLWYYNKFGDNHSGIRQNTRTELWNVNCPQMMWLENDVEIQLKERLKTLTFDDVTYEKIREKLFQEWNNRTTLSDLQKKAVENELKEKERLRGALLRNMVLVEYQDDIKVELNKVKKEIEIISKELKEINEVANIDVNKVETLIDLSRNLYEQYDRLDEMNKRRLIMAVFKKITLVKGTIKGDDVCFVDAEYTDVFEELFNRYLKKLIETKKKSTLVKEELTV